MGGHFSSLKRENKKKKVQKSSKSSDVLSDTQSFISNSSSESSSSFSTYFLKDNEIEFDRLQRTHFFAKYIFDGKNFSAPCTEILESGCRVLDVGCGSGAWVLDCATEFKKSTFVGVDMSPMFPQAIKPCNAMFIQGNILDGLPFESNSFEIVHLGNMGSCFTEEEWKITVIPEVIRVMKPGGWLEILEYAFRMHDNGPCNTRILAAVRSYMSELGINVDFIEQMKDWLVDNVEALTDVQELVVNQPLGCGNKLGPVYVDLATPAMKFLSPQLTRIMNITEDEFDKLVDGFREEHKFHKQVLTYYKIFARKLKNE